MDLQSRGRACQFGGGYGVQCSIQLVPLTLTTTTLVKLVIANLKHIQTCYHKTARDHKTFPIMDHSTTKKLKSLDSQQGLWPQTLMGSLGMAMECGFTTMGFNSSDTHPR
jgi:hypothetical protein